MKHIKFSFAKPIVGIQQVGDKVFLGNDYTVLFSSSYLRDRVKNAIKDICPDLYLFTKPWTASSQTTIGLWNCLFIDSDSGYYFTEHDGEIYLIKGRDDLIIEG